MTATGTPAPSFLWFKNGRMIPGANGATLTIASASLADAGVYSVWVFSRSGFVRSDPAALSVAAGLAASRSRSCTTPIRPRRRRPCRRRRW